MTEETITLIENNNVDLYDNFISLLPLIIRFVLPVAGSIAIIFFGVKVFRRVTNV